MLSPTSMADVPLHATSKAAAMENIEETIFILLVVQIVYVVT